MKTENIYANLMQIAIKLEILFNLISVGILTKSQ